MYVRNYIDTDCFNKIIDNDTFIACAKNITNKQSIVNYAKFSGEFGPSIINESLYTFITLLLMYSKRKLNKGFYFFFKRRNVAIYYPSKKIKNKVAEWCSNSLCQLIIIHVLEFIRPFFRPFQFLKFCLILIIDFFGLTNMVVKLYKCLPIENKELKSIINRINPDLVLIPSSGLDSFAGEVSFLSRKKYKFKTMYLIDNWDNLSSKSVFPTEPDYLCVWGEQAKRHAKDFHKFDLSKVFLAGTPRFDVYYDYENNKQKLKEKYQEVLNFPYILYTGCTSDFDDISVLEILNGLIDKYQNLLPDQCKVLYRPHPWGSQLDKLDYLLSKGLKNIEIDPQMLKKNRNDYKHFKDFQPELDFYPFLLDKSEFLICPLATLILEASIMNKKVLVLVHDDGKSFLNPSFVYKNSNHFERLSDMKNLLLLDNIINLDEFLHQMITSNMHIDKKVLDYHIVDDGQLYSDRIATICNKLALPGA